MMGAPLWRKYLKPRLKIMYETARKKGMRIMTHTCGDVTEIFPDMIELGIECINDIQPECMDLTFLKREYGKDIVLFGGLGSQSTIPGSTPEEVVREAEERLALLGAGGRCIIGPAGAIPAEAPVENVVSLIEYFKKTLGG
ncbi:hypothetical protein SDC9_169576 [bioreactor metagenome]|uniref:Uroporphyrinogen decarboxylase (URO-D) domain-containing protein n=1 Tax=bioreactor metagenome TaxID=1076179 RepID=A0A645GEH1_9ZZZZ